MTMLLALPASWMAARMPVPAVPVAVTGPEPTIEMAP